MGACGIYFNSKHSMQNFKGTERSVIHVYKSKKCEIHLQRRPRYSVSHTCELMVGVTFRVVALL